MRRRKKRKLKVMAKAVVAANKLRRAPGPSGLLDDFEFTGGDIGRGALSVVKTVARRQTGELYACKCVQKRMLSLKGRKALLAEAALMRDLDHPHVVRLWHCYQDAKCYYIVMDLIQGGELFDRIVQKTHYNERDARDLVRKLLDVLCYLHFEVAIAHRDIKPENILCVDHDDTNIKLCDFGFAAPLDMAAPDKCLTKVCGTPQYVAPEVLSHRPYGAGCDMWSLGVVAFILLAGYAPFADTSHASLNVNILAGNYSFPRTYWANVSSDAKNFISRLLTVDPGLRADAETALAHPWIAEDPKHLQKNNLAKSLEQIKTHRHTFRSAARAVIAAQRLAHGLGSWSRPH